VNCGRMKISEKVILLHIVANTRAQGGFWITSRATRINVAIFKHSAVMAFFEQFLLEKSLSLAALAGIVPLHSCCPHFQSQHQRQQQRALMRFFHSFLRRQSEVAFACVLSIASRFTPFCNSISMILQVICSVFSLELEAAL